MPIVELVTHDGKFHADEALSAGILSDLFPMARLVRSRDPELTTPAEGRIVFDVGGAWDPDRMLFDHHQAGAPLREDGSAFSSIGLVWSVFGQDWLRLCGFGEEAATIHGKIDRGIIAAIDAADTGALAPAAAGAFRNMTLPAMIDDLNPVFDDEDPGAADRAFRRAMALGRDFLGARAAVVAATLRAETTVREAILAAWPSPVLELPKGMPHERVIRDMKAEHILFVVIPRGEEWAISAVRDEPGSFASRKDLPADWAGLAGAELGAVIGIPDAVFCHKARFMAVAGSRDSILKMARIAADREPEAEPSL